MVQLVAEYVIPAAFAILPAALRSDEAASLLLAIGAQESRFATRHQRPVGPALGFWQFERAGLRAVLSHPRTKEIAARVITTMDYDGRAFVTLHQALEHNDIFAAAIARLLLWADPAPLPGPEAADDAWHTYLRTWCPGRPRPATWAPYYADAWRRVAVLSANGANRDAARVDRRATA
jgi:hypothetical protein